MAEGRDFSRRRAWLLRRRGDIRARKRHTARRKTRRRAWVVCRKRPPNANRRQFGACAPFCDTSRRLAHGMPV